MPGERNAGPAMSVSMNVAVPAGRCKLTCSMPPASTGESSQHQRPADPATPSRSSHPPGLHAYGFSSTGQPWRSSVLTRCADRGSRAPLGYASRIARLVSCRVTVNGRTRYMDGAVCCGWGLDRRIKRPGTVAHPRRRRWRSAATVHRQLNLGDTMRRVIIRSLATTAVLGGVILTGAGVAAADTGRPTGGTGPDQPTCAPGNIDLSQNCLLAPGGGRLF